MIRTNGYVRMNDELTPKKEHAPKPHDGDALARFHLRESARVAHDLLPQMRAERDRARVEFERKQRIVDQMELLLRAVELMRVDL